MREKRGGVERERVVTELLGSEGGGGAERERHTHISSNACRLSQAFFGLLLFY